ncbi:MAG: hypothetical protein ACFCGT_17185 [Sandaracinaceae bacterium]
MKSLLSRLAILRRGLAIAALFVAVWVVAPIAKAEAWLDQRGVRFRPNANTLIWLLVAAWVGYVGFQMLAGGCPMSSSPCSSPCMR